jgi:hypothetical protein
MLTPAETPFLSSFPRTKAKSTLHEWMTDSLTAPATNAQIEAADYSYTKGTTPTRLTNRTQLFYTTWEVSDTVQASDPAGYESELARQKMKKMKEHARDIEVALITGTGNSGASGTARTMKGVLGFITGNVTTGTGTGNEALTETVLNDALQAIWDDSGMEGGYTVYAPGSQKRVIDGFTAGSTKFTDPADKKLTTPVNIYESSFGIVKIKMHRHLTAGNVVILADDMWKTAWLQPTHEPTGIARVGSAVRGVVQSEVTLVSVNQDASAKITELS